MSGVVCPNCGELDYSAWGDMPCFCRMQAQEQDQKWTAEDECASHGHAYYGDESADGPGRCYCGQRTFPPGGISESVEGRTRQGPLHPLGGAA